MTNFKFTFVIVSKDEKFLLSEEDFLSLSNICNYDLFLVKNNKEFITKIYNNYIDKSKNILQSDFIIFMHSDVKLNLIKLVNQIIECKDKYDIMGLCGTEVMNVSKSPLNWFTSSNPTPDKRWGCVTHGEIGNRTSFFSQHHPNITDHEVACIDGLCIIYGPKAIQNNIKFDERLQFDCYDTDISLQTLLTYKLKLGVLVHQELQHYSIGRSILSSNFLNNEKILRDKWKI